MRSADSGFLFKALSFCCLTLPLVNGTNAQQQEIGYTQYMYNTAHINPAYVGSSGFTQFGMFYRKQWMRIDGAPESLSFFLGSPIGVSKRVGLGLSAVKEAIGPSDNTSLVINYSYTLYLGRRWGQRLSYLSFGLKFGGDLLNVDYSKLEPYDIGDRRFRFDIVDRLDPLVGAGIYWHNDETFYIGISSPNVLEATYFDDVLVANATQRANFYLIGGYVFNLHNDWRMKSAFLGRYVAGAPIVTNLSLNFVYNDYLDLGISYGLRSRLSGLAGFQVSPRLWLGYAYDHDIQGLGQFSGGSHEMFLRYFIGSKKQRLSIPRLY